MKGLTLQKLKNNNLLNQALVNHVSDGWDEKIWNIVLGIGAENYFIIRDMVDSKIIESIGIQEYEIIDLPCHMKRLKAMEICNNFIDVANITLMIDSRDSYEAVITQGVDNLKERLNDSFMSIGRDHMPFYLISNPQVIKQYKSNIEICKLFELSSYYASILQIRNLQEVMSITLESGVRGRKVFDTWGWSQKVQQSSNLDIMSLLNIFDNDIVAIVDLHTLNTGYIDFTFQKIKSKAMFSALSKNMKKGEQSLMFMFKINFFNNVRDALLGMKKQGVSKKPDEIIDEVNGKIRNSIYGKYPLSGNV